MGDVCNVMYFNHDGSLYVNDVDDNSVQVHGVKPEHLIMLMRNLLCAGDALEFETLKDYQKEQLEEIHTKLNKQLTKEVPN